MDKTYISPQQLYDKSFELAAQIVESKLRPDLLLGVWRGGTPVAITVHEVLQVCGMPCEHLPVKTSSYLGIDQQSAKVEIWGLSEMKLTIANANSILVVDDVFDTGNSVLHLHDGLREINSLCSIKIACPYYKPSRNQTRLHPDFYIEETTEWLVFPHELEGLSVDEIIKNKADFRNLVNLIEETTDV